MSLAILVQGPSGTGKSHFARSAAISLGSAAIASVPYDDERSLYEPLVEYKPNDFVLRSIGSIKQGREFLGEIYKENKAEVRHKLLILDAWTGFDTLSVTDRLGGNDFPKALSPDGADLYSGLRKDMEDIINLARRIRSLGIHFIAIAHTLRKKDEDSNLVDNATGSTIHMPVFRGSFREQSHAPFDIVFHARRKRNTDKTMSYQLQWQSSSKVPTKSRYGGLSSTDYLPNLWTEVVSAVESAKQRTAEQLRQEMEQ